MAARVALMTWLSVALATGAARADDVACEELPDEEVRARLRQVRRAIEVHEPDTRRWATAFLSLHLAMVGVQLSLALTADNEGAQVDGWVGAFSSALGVGTLLVSFPSLIGAGDAIDALPVATAAERRASLARAEQRMRRASDQVAFVRSPFTTTLNALYVGSAGAFTLLGWRRIAGGFLLAIGGSVLSQGRVLLFPTGIREAWLRYRRAHPDAACSPDEPDEPAASGPPRLVVAPAGVGASLFLTF